MATLLNLFIFLVLTLVLLLATHLTANGRAKRMAARVRQVRAARTSLTAGADASRQGSVRRQPTRTLSGNIGQRLASLLPRSELLRLRLDQGGVSLSVIDFSLACIGLGLAISVFLWLGIGLAPIQAFGIGLLGATILPHLVLKRCSARRRDIFVKQFPDAIDLVVRGVKSGLPVTESLQAAGDELTGQIGSLFQEVTGSIKLGKSLEEALLAASAKMPAPELRFFVISLAVQQETGGNLAEILQNLVALMRRRSQVKLKIKSMSSEARASAMIIGSLPFVMSGLLFLVDPTYITQLFVNRLGLILLTAGLISLTIGISVMAKMIQFEI